MVSIMKNNMDTTSILIVENAKSLNKMVNNELTQLGYSCDSAFSLKNIQDKTSQTTYDYIVLNLYLSDAQEVELIDSVVKLSEAKIIVLTSIMNDKLRDRIFKRGILDYLYKQNIKKTISDIHTLIEGVEKNSLSTILVIDKSRAVRWKIKSILNLRNYNVLSCSTGKEGLEIIEDTDIDIDLVILEMHLSDMYGLEVLRKIKSNDEHTFPIIALSNSKDDDMIRKALKGGVVDFIRKSVSVEEFLLKSDLWVDYYRQSKELEEHKYHLEDKVKHGISTIELLNKEIEDTQAEVIFRMGAIGEGRCKETASHVKRVAKYSKLLAQLYGLGDKEAQLLELASPMHDIRKIAISETILNKPGRLSPEERRIMMDHPKFGHDMLSGSNRKVMKAASIVSYEHHEKFDGSGYPRGLVGEDIHIYGRITAVADVFDALGTQRVYKNAWSDERIFDLFENEKGKHFDPKLVELFFENLEMFFAIRDKYQDYI